MGYQPIDNYGIVSEGLNLALVTSVELVADDLGVTAEFVLEEGEYCPRGIRYLERGPQRPGDRSNGQRHCRQHSHHVSGAGASSVG